MKLNMNKDELRKFLLHAPQASIIKYVESIHPVDILDVLRDYPEDKEDILYRLPEGLIADIIDEADDEEKYSILMEFSENKQKNIVEEMSSDELTDLLGMLDEEKANKILEKMTDEDARKVRQLLSYDPDTAAGIMATEFVALKENMTDATKIIIAQRVSTIMDADQILVLDEGNLVGIGKHEDLIKTDHAAMECIPKERRGQDMDNWIWIRDAEKNNLVVGTQARILYQDALGRMNIALRFNEMVRKGEVGPIMLGRDHHDVSGTDSPFRETSNIKDGSNVMADMAVQCFAGNCARGMSLVALHNGGGVGIGKAVNGGFGMVCDGSDRVDAILRSSMLWDVMGGVARRSWARNPHAMETSEEFNHTHREQGYHITMPHLAEDALIDRVLKEKGIKHQ